MLNWLAALRYGSGPTTWTATVPVRPWTPRRSWVGGSLEVASGLIESYTIRTDKLLTVTFRVAEDELPAFLLAVDAGVQNPGDLEFYPNGVSGTGYPVYVLSPRHGEDFEPARTDQMAGAEAGSLFDCTLVLRRVDGQAWDLNYYAAA